MNAEDALFEFLKITNEFMGKHAPVGAKYTLIAKLGDAVGSTGNTLASRSRQTMALVLSLDYSDSVEHADAAVRRMVDMGLTQ